jgi:hypothetical protein
MTSEAAKDWQNRDWKEAPMPHTLRFRVVSISSVSSRRQAGVVPAAADQQRRFSATGDSAGLVRSEFCARGGVWLLRDGCPTLHSGEVAVELLQTDRLGLSHQAPVGIQ